MPVYTLSPDSSEPYECAAALLALLAYPHPAADTSERPAFHAALCRAALLGCAADDPDWLWHSQPIKPGYLLLEEATADRGLAQGQKRLDERLIAARMALPFLQQASTGQPPKLPKALPRWSLNGMADLVLDQARQSDPHNLEARVFRPSLPVIHLAAALLIASDGLEAPLGHRLSAWHLFYDRELTIVRWLVDAAQQYEALLPRMRHFRVPPEAVIRLRLR